MKTKVLHLTLHKVWFDQILAGEKHTEFRSHTPYWFSRLHNREYDHIHFVNGYGKDKPWADVEFLGAEYSFDSLMYEIKLGKVIKSGNIK